MVLTSNRPKLNRPSIAIAQNRVLTSIDQKIDRVSLHVSQHDHRLQTLDTVFKDMSSDLQARIAKLHSDLHRFIDQGYVGPVFDKKEREIKQLKQQLDQMAKDHFHHSTPYTHSQSLFFFGVSSITSIQAY